MSARSHSNVSRLTKHDKRFVMLGAAMLMISGVLAKDDPHENLESLYKLRDRGAWQEIVDSTASVRQLDVERRFLRGVALAHLGRLPEAETELKQAAEQGGPKSGKILVELAGVQFRQKRLDESSKNLRRAIPLGQTDPYVINFLASLYYLQGNLEAAVKYWNRVGKPNIQELTVSPAGILNPLLLDRALAVSPYSDLDLRSLRLTDLRLEMLDIFAGRRYDLSARPDGQFDLSIQTAEKADLPGDSALRSLAMVARELPFQTINADFRNIRRSAVNWSSAMTMRRRPRVRLSRHQ